MLELKLKFQDSDGYALLGYTGASAAGYDVGDQCEPNEHYLHSVRLQQAASRQSQEHRRPGK